MRKNIKNYTSEVPVNRSVQNILEMLAKAGAKKIMQDYDSTGSISSITFALEIEGKGMIPYVLPVSIEKLAVVMYSVKFNGLNDKAKLQVRRTAWKNIHDWIDAQMALIETEMAEVPQIFLPYMQTSINGLTAYDEFKSGKLLSAGQSKDPVEGIIE